MSLWNRYNASVFQKLQAAYIKCIKLFFNFDRRESVSAIFIKLGLPTMSTLAHNAKFRHSVVIRCSDNVLVRYVHEVCAMQC